MTQKKKQAQYDQFKVRCITRERQAHIFRNFVYYYPLPATLEEKIQKYRLSNVINYDS